MHGRFRCAACGAEHGVDLRRHRCPQCGGVFSYERDAPPSFPARRDGGGRALPPLPSGIWRFADALPTLPDPVSLGEPETPLVPLAPSPGGAGAGASCVPLERGADEPLLPPDLDGIRVLAKCEFVLPTGSYKDRGAAVLATWLRHLGVPEAVEDSSGNAGAALAAYAGRAGIRLKVFCPASAAAGKLVQIRLYGAELVRVEGPRPRATEALLEYLQQGQAVYASHLWSPLFLEGVKTLAFEVWEQLAGTPPDLVL
ncbi:MAG: pyridoxal-phosphate dependent enzyme, partial [Candidatus Latescibacterota bacterium]